jgi:tripartite-type tricarboxylate transporter receptor subunit TctC
MSNRHSFLSRRWLFAALSAGAACAATLTTAAHGADYPEKPIRIVVPSSPGGSADAVARMVGERLTRTMGQSVIIENRGGGGGNIATTLVASAAPDGYTILLTGNNHTLNVSLYAKSPYALSDFAPVIELTRGPSVFVAAPNAPFATLAEMIAKAKAAPDSISYGSPGIGLPSHIAAELFKRAANVQLAHVAYKGSGPSLMDAMGGQIPMVSSTLAAAMPHIKSGKLKPLAVTSATRWPSLPEVPTVAESGMPGYSHLTWLGLLVPKGTPADVVAKLNRETGKILADPEVKSKLELLGTSPVGGSSANFQKMLDEEYVTSKALVQSAGLRAE